MDYMDNATYLIENFCAFYPSFANHFEKRTKEQKAILRRQCEPVNKYTRDLIDRAMTSLQKKYPVGGKAPEINEVISCASLLLNKTYDRHDKPSYRYDLIKDEIYLTARQELAIRKSQMNDLFNQIKTKHKINGASFISLMGTKGARGSTIGDELMGTYREIQKSIVEDIYPVLAHFEKKSLSAVTIADLHGKYGV